MGCRPSRRSAGRVRDFNHTRKNNNSYAYLSETSERSSTSDKSRKVGSRHVSSKRGNSNDGVKEFNNFSTTSKTYFKAGSRSSKITLRLSTDGTTLEIEEFEIQPFGVTAAPDDLDSSEDETEVLQMKYSSAPNLSNPEISNVYSKRQFDRILHGVDVNSNQTGPQSGDCFGSLRAPLATVELDYIGDEDDNKNSVLSKREYHITQSEEDLILLSGLSNNANNRELLANCEHLNKNDIQCVDIDVHCNPVETSLIADDKVVSSIHEDELSLADDQVRQRCNMNTCDCRVTIKDPMKQAPHVLSKSPLQAASSRYQLSPDICKMKSERNYVNNKALSLSEAVNGCRTNTQPMSGTEELCLSASRSLLPEMISRSQLVSSDITSPHDKCDSSITQLLKPGSTKSIKTSPTHALSNLRIQSDGFDCAGEDTINLSDSECCLIDISSRFSDFDDQSQSVTYASANSDVTYSDEEEFLIPFPSTDKLSSCQNLDDNRNVTPLISANIDL